LITPGTEHCVCYRSLKERWFW